ncbi:TPA: hypothetical protein DEP34_03315 [Candidatus Uhrbacteria bacterium]|uniref:Uncharacterized protein n=2 Tax=Candidatus Uhriibacteriota TaxID=1752732 RepID=A0A0G1Q8L1_9BACT|nr:MAG: hypothetical protein UX45_C0001G0102 [Candidatus Uhrbacteria bacterium GW2011_GWF2_46_218]KKU41334.1 MAG: hypothetical protein UX57_C0004G0038 [Candidatus Uhrbacteria bacterium GW2011_GWE2_46_68]HBK33769.1 hypothetical protein [Candidatus Uhrbacteria bacterium]HCB19389.1 hypothetical protein [Candidatus Uhrbacteria bacterium]
MTLMPYHQKYRLRSDEEIHRRADVKEEELRRIFEAMNYKPTDNLIRVAVLGCVDPRMVSHHKRMFEKLLGKPVELTTFDITIEHLQGEAGIVEHDCTFPIPHPPYHITFGHVLLKFIETEKQWDVIKNSYEALMSDGLAIHVYDEEDVTTTAVKQVDGGWPVPLTRWKKKLEETGVTFQDLRWEIALEQIPIPIRGLKGGALVIKK